MEEKILAILESLHPEYDYKNSQDFLADGLLDSFDMVALVAGIESEFGIKIDGMDIVPENFVNIATLTALVRKVQG